MGFGQLQEASPGLGTGGVEEFHELEGHNNQLRLPHLVATAAATWEVGQRPRSFSSKDITISMAMVTEKHAKASNNREKLSRR